MYSLYQSSYFAHWLSLARHYEETLTKTIASAKVDMNPHQVNAALFALRSPMSKGVILADEVGLGKTIEAGLVLAQRWAEQKRHLILIVPATLRKQWSQELLDKFELPSIILEAKDFKPARERGIENPFDTKVAGKSAIVIVSYEFAARKDIELGRVPWDLVVFDEAHKLRNVYKKDGAKIAKTLNETLRSHQKILLTATPLQNTILELYGLVSVIDPYFFGDLDSFKMRYARQGVTPSELALLRKRLSGIVNRTLRKQVQETGSFNFTRRYSLTEDFNPSSQELALYQEVSTYLQRDDLLAIKPEARHLVTLVIRKILASSSYAIQGTFSSMITRLRKKLPLLEGLHQDYESLDDLGDIDDVECEETVDLKALENEIVLLEEFKVQAGRIEMDAKADALLRVLNRAFEMTERLGGRRKAVIFTESKRTQSWLYSLLSDNGFAGKLVLLNGSNKDPDSQEIYQQWLIKHRGSVKISGSRTADMKAALVEKFRDDATLMISTEAGAEGINLQFCSLLINYDLPWNPQRVEQRIGRIHRYGQKHDVVVVNFINKGNRADERVFELLNKKLQLFEGVFGASDEILGSIESGIDIERRIQAIYQKCRSDQEIDDEFNALQDALKTDLEAQVKETSRSVLEYFDTDVVKILKMRSETTAQQLGKYQHMMMRLAEAELPEARFETDRFYYDESWFDLNWPHAEANDAQFFRPHEGLGKVLIAKSLEYDCLSGDVLMLNYALLGPGAQRADVRGLIGKAGEISVEKYTIKTRHQTLEFLVVAACSDDGDVLEAKTAHRLLLVPGTSQVANNVISQEEKLQVRLAELRSQHFEAAERNNEKYYEEETQKLEFWSDDRKVALDIRIKQLDKEITDARRAARQLPSLQEKIAAKRVIKKLERQRDDTMLRYHDEKKKIEAKEDELLEEVAAALDMTASQEPLFTIRWQLREGL